MVKRPLIIAEMANPEFVSIPLEGWALSRAIQEKTAAHIVTQIRNRDAFVRAGLTEGKDFTAIDSEAVARRATSVAGALRFGRGKGWTAVTAMHGLSYQYFERLVWKTFGSRISSGEFDLVHRLTPISPTISSPMAKRFASTGRPFVIGPMNGGLPWPAGFDHARRLEREYLSYIRGLYKLLPGPKRTLRAATAIVAGSHSTAGELPEWSRERQIYVPENAIDPERFNKPAKPAVNTPLRACFIGRLVPYKGADMLLEAAAPLLRAGTLAVDLIGDGPMMPELREMAARDGLGDAVTFHGWQAHAELQEIVQRADLFAFPSVREFGGAVVLEAMSLGVVPIVVAYGGPGEHVTPETGFVVPIGSRADIVAGFRDRLAALVDSPEALPVMASAARDRVLRKYTWERKAEQMLAVYEWALAPEGPRPDPFHTM